MAGRSKAERSQAERAPSVKDVAALAGVSLGTVSNVLNAPDRVSEKLRERVHAAIEELGWTPNESARSLRVGRSRTIALVVMDIGNPFFTDLSEGAQDAVEARGFSLHVANSRHSEEQESRHLAAFAEQSAGGVLLAPIRGATEAVRRLRRRGIPVVLLDRTDGRGEYCSVSVDDVEGGSLGVGHLLDQGHRRIALIGGPGDLRQVADRRRGAELATSGRGPVDLLVMSTDELDVPSGVHAAQQLALLPPAERPTAAFAMNDLLAIGLLQGLVTAGLRVPDDVAIVGYDDIDFAAAAAVPLSSVRQPRHDLGHGAAELLFAELADLDTRSGSGSPHRHVQLKFLPELVVRRSSAR